MDYGTTILSMAVMAIIITAPTGAILINSLGPKWLSYDGDDPEWLATQAKSHTHEHDDDNEKDK